MPLQFKTKETIVVVSEGINNGVGLIICCAGGIVVVKISQPLILIRFKPFILVLGRVSGAVDNVPGFRDALELFAMVFCTECL